MLEGMRRTSEVEVEAALIPDDREVEEQEEDVDVVNEMRVVCDEVDGTVPPPASTRVRKRTLKDDAGRSKKKVSTGVGRFSLDTKVRSNG